MSELSRPNNLEEEKICQIALAGVQKFMDILVDNVEPARDDNDRDVL